MQNTDWTPRGTEKITGRRASIRVLALMEASRVTGPAKNLIAFVRSARGSCLESASVDLSVVTFQRGSLHPPNAFVAACREAGIPVDVIPERRAFDTSILPRLQSAIAGRAPDIVQSHNTKSHFLVRWTGICNRYPWIAFDHGHTVPDLKMRLYNQLDRWSLRAARHVVTMCRSFALELQRRGIPPSRMTVRPNGVRPFVPAAPGEVERLRSLLGVPAGAAVVLSAGRLSMEKGHRDLVEAAALVRRLRPSAAFRIVIAGEGPERAALERRRRDLGLEELVILAGHQDDLRPYYSLASVFALPSHSEGSPNVLLEAMAAGLPAVATAVGGVPDIATEGRDALLIGRRNPAAMADALVRLLDDRRLGEALGEAARETAGRFTPELSCRTVLEVYDRVLAHCGSPLSACAYR